MGVGETATGDASAVGVAGYVGGTEFSRSWGGGAAAFLTVHTSGELMGTVCKHTVTQTVVSSLLGSPRPGGPQVPSTQEAGHVRAVGDPTHPHLHIWTLSKACPLESKQV